MKRFLATLVVISAMAGLVGCDEEPWGLDQNIIGNWREIAPAFYPYFRVTFNVDGVVVFDGSPVSGHYPYAKYSGVGSWHTEGTTLTVSMFSKNYSDVFQYRQSEDRLTLTTIDGYVIECIRE